MSKAVVLLFVAILFAPFVLAEKKNAGRDDRQGFDSWT